MTDSVLYLVGISSPTVDQDVYFTPDEVSFMDPSLV